MKEIIILSQTVEQGNLDRFDTGIAFGAMIIAAISLAVSVFAIYQNRKINTTNLEAKYFEEVFREYIVHVIPECVSKLSFEDDKLNNTYKELNSIMMEMIRDARYYAYAKRDFYLELQNKIMELDDTLVTKAGEVVTDKDAQVKFIYSVHTDIMEIIKYINKNYHDF